MSKHIPEILFAVIVGLAVSAGDNAYAQDADEQPEFPKIVRQPEDQAIRIGSNVTFSVTAENGESFQWARNGVELQGQTNSTLKLSAVGTADVGLYSCQVAKGEEAVPTRVATLNVFASLNGGGGGPIIVFGTPILGGGSQQGCPGNYAGFVNYIKPSTQWGWVPTLGAPVHSATDTNRTDTAIVYLGRFGDADCGLTTVSVADPVISTSYRFTVYFPNNVPTNTYPLVLDGFNP